MRFESDVGRRFGRTWCTALNFEVNHKVVPASAWLAACVRIFHRELPEFYGTFLSWRARSVAGKRLWPRGQARARRSFDALEYTHTCVLCMRLNILAESISRSRGWWREVVLAAQTSKHTFDDNSISAAPIVPLSLYIHSLEISSCGFVCAEQITHRLSHVHLTSYANCSDINN